MITKDTVLPTYEELTVEECNLSSPYLKAGAFHLGKECEAINNEFMLCKDEENDPRKCLGEGKAVTKCALNFFRKVKQSCAQEFADYAKCLDFSGADMMYFRCRNTQAIFDSCVYEKLKMKRPPYGYFTEVHIHDSTRPKPPPEPPLVFPDALPDPPSDDLPRVRGRQGSRTYTSV